MIVTVLFFVLAWLLFSTTMYQFVTMGLLVRYLRRKRRVRNSLVKAQSFPGISVLIPVKGVYPTFAGNLRSILEQDYPGPFEVILGVQLEEDPVLEVSRKVAATLGALEKMKFAVGGKDAGLNPKNSNLCRAFPKARYDWIYCSDADVALEPSFFTSAMAEMDENKYASTFNIFRGANSIGSMLEAVGTTVEAGAFFLLSALMPKKGLMNGASMLFHKSLLARAGGIAVAVNQITDDLYLSAIFNEKGAEFVLLPNNVWELDMPAQPFAAFWSRIVRWLLILKCNRRVFFFSAPSGWVWQWCLLASLLTMSARIGALFVVAFFFRVLFAFVFETALAGWRESWKIIVIPLYDLCGPAAWFVSLFQKRITWAGNLMVVSASGELEKI